MHRRIFNPIYTPLAPSLRHGRGSPTKSWTLKDQRYIISGRVKLKKHKNFVPPAGETKHDGWWFQRSTVLVPSGLVPDRNTVPNRTRTQSGSWLVWRCSKTRVWMVWFHCPPVGVSNVAVIIASLTLWTIFKHRNVCENQNRSSQVLPALELEVQTRSATWPVCRKQRPPMGTCGTVRGFLSVCWNWMFVLFVQTSSVCPHHPPLWGKLGLSDITGGSWEVLRRGVFVWILNYCPLLYAWPPCTVFLLKISLVTGPGCGPQPSLLLQSDQLLLSLWAPFFRPIILLHFIEDNIFFICLASDLLTQWAKTLY